MRRKQSCMVSENEIFLPEEILSEILSWLDVKSLLRCKSVSKLWYVVIDDKQFVEMHAIRNNHRSYYITVQGESDNSDQIECLSCNYRGFLVEKILPLERFRIRNPTTKRILDLPDPHKGVIDMAVFLNSYTSSYNVLSIYKENNKAGFQLIDLGGQSNDPYPNSDLSWRPFNISAYDDLWKTQRYSFDMLRSEEGVLYILPLVNVGSDIPKLICYDIATQSSTTVNMPVNNMSFSGQEVDLRKLRGKAAISFVAQENLNIWVLEDYQKHKWADTMQIHLPFLKQYPELKTWIPVMYCSDQEDFLVYHKSDKGFIIYKLKSQIFGYVPSLRERIAATLVSVEGMQSEKSEAAN